MTRGKAPQHAPVRGIFAAARAPVKNDAGGTVEEAGDLCVPHHPACRAVPVVALAPVVCLVAAAHVVVQNFERQRHQYGATVAVHDGLGQAGGAAAVHNPQWVVKGQPFGCKRRHRRVLALHQVVQAKPARGQRLLGQLAPGHHVG